jgi:LacI family transcriptional regulator
LLVTARIHDVAARAGVSTATVSRVLSGVDFVSADLSEKVWAAIHELGYRPNRVARRLRRPGREMWALIVNDIENRFFTSVARGVEDVANEYGITVFIGNTDNDAARLQRYLETALAEQVAGIILAPNSADDDISAIIASHTPMVTIDQPITSAGLPTVTTDHLLGGRLAGQIIAERGYSSIGVVAGPEQNAAWNTRLDGLTSSFRDSDVKILIERGDNRAGGGAAATGRLLSRDPGLEALFVTNNLMTIGALRELDSRGIEVPSGIDVIGYDLNSQDWTRSVPVTSVNQDPRRIGEVAARTLIELQQAPEREPNSELILLPPHLQNPS